MSRQMNTPVEVHGLVDRTGWPSGGWDSEPDRIDWDYAGFPCMMLRHTRKGNWCGYVGVAPGHPWYERDFMDVPADVHGSLTYASACWGEPPTGICHVPRSPEDDHRWWLGFDCHHHMDIAPGWLAKYPEDACGCYEQAYRTVAYVRAEVERLAEQAAEAAQPGATS